MTDATSLTARFYSAPRIIEADGRDHNDRPHWKVEGVTIQAGENDTLEIRQTNRYGDGHEMRVRVQDGELTFPLEDLVPLVLERLDIRGLSAMICGDEEARRALLDALVTRYNENGIEDQDRRYWLAKVQETIHDKALDRFVDAMTGIERTASQMGYRAMGDIAYDNVLRHELERAGVAPEAALEASRRYHPEQGLIDMKPYVWNVGFGQGAWHEAREFWRAKAAELFAAPTVPDKLDDLRFVSGEPGEVVQ